MLINKPFPYYKAAVFSFPWLGVCFFSTLLLNSKDVYSKGLDQRFFVVLVVRKMSPKIISRGLLGSRAQKSRTKLRQSHNRLFFTNFDLLSIAFWTFWVSGLNGPGNLFSDTLCNFGPNGPSNPVAGKVFASICGFFEHCLSSTPQEMRSFHIAHVTTLSAVFAGDGLHCARPIVRRVGALLIRDVHSAPKTLVACWICVEVGQVTQWLLPLLWSPTAACSTRKGCIASKGSVTIKVMKR